MVEGAPARLSHYRIVDLLGRGGMGVVYRAHDEAHDREVALKVLPPEATRDPERRARFLREAATASRVIHPGVATVFATEDLGDQVLIAMELVHGEPLRREIARGPLPIERAVALSIQLVEALDAAHAIGIVHRDLKPENVIVTVAGRAKLLDFGLAKLGGDAAPALADTALTREGTIFGTPAYMSPEQARGLEVDARSDLFSFGIVLFEMLTGRPPFRGNDPLALALAIVGDRASAPSELVKDVPRALDAIVARCLEKAPDARHRNAAEVAAALRECLTATTSGDAPTLARTVAVLPFTDLSPGHDEEPFCEGLAEEILNALLRLPVLRVVARGSSFRYRGADPRTIAQDLGVDVVVEGSVRKAGLRLRVSARLVDARTGFALWQQVFDRDLSDVFEIQDEISRAIAETLAAGAFASAAPRRPDRDVDAYELVLRGRYLWNRRPGPSVWEGLACFERALERDPTDPAALAGIADVYATLGSWEAGVLPPAEAQSKAREYALRALDLDPAQPDARATLAYTALHFAWDRAQAEAGFRQALAANPSHAAARHWYSHSLVASGRFAESLAESQHALAIDPANPLIAIHLSWHHHMARDPAATVEQAERVRRTEPAFHWAHYFLGWGREALGDPSGAVAAMRDAVRHSGDNKVMSAGLGRALARAGDRNAALAIAKELDARLFAYELALVHLALEDHATALDHLERSAAERSGWLVYLDVEPRLDPLRDEPRFAALRARLW